MSMSLPGLATGMDTRDLVNQLMQAESIPQQQLQRRVSSANSYLQALRTLNTSIAEFGTRAAEASKPAALRTYAATSSHESIAAVAGSGAGTVSMTFTVDAVAARHSVVTDPVSEWSSQTMEITTGDGVTHRIDAASASVSDMVTAINRADIGIQATRVPVGDGQYRLQLTSQETGAASAFTVGDGAPTTTVTEGADAALVLWAGTAAEQRITSSSNTFSDLMDGVDITVSSVSASPVTVSVERDLEAATEKAGKLVTDLQSIFSRISRNTAVSVDGDDVSGSVLTGDSTARTARNQLQQAATAPVNGESLSTIGIEITRRGELTFDAEKFSAALAENPEKVEAMFAEFAGRLDTAATNLSDRYDGLLTSRITGQESTIRRMENAVEAWDVRLEKRRETLTRQYAQLEVMISTMNAQMDYLQSQLGGLSQPA